MVELLQRIFKKEKIFFFIVLLGISFLLIFSVLPNKAFSSSYTFLIFLLLLMNFLVFAASSDEEVPDKGQAVGYFMFFRILFSVILLLVLLPGILNFKGSALSTGVLYLTVLLLAISILLDFLGAFKILKHNNVGKIIAISVSIVMFYLLLVNYLTLIPTKTSKEIELDRISQRTPISGALSRPEKAKIGNLISIIKGLQPAEKVTRKNEENNKTKPTIDQNLIKEELIPYPIRQDSKPLVWRKIEIKSLGMISLSAPKATPVSVSYGMLGDVPDFSQCRTMYKLGTLIPN